MTPKSKRLWLLRLARASRRRLDETIEVLEDRHFSDAEAATFEKLVWDTYQALFGDGKGLQWLLFVRALENSTQFLPKGSHSVIARHALDAYGEVFPDVARKIDRAKVILAVAAWREDRNYFDAIRAALLSALPASRVPTSRSMATKWSAATTAAPWTAASRRRQRRRGSDERPRGVRLDKRRKGG